MKGIKKASFARPLAMGLLLAASLPLIGRQPDRPPGSQGVQSARPKAAACVPASQRTELAYNNVRAIIENGGNMWQRRGGNSLPGYEIPKNEENPFSNASAIYAGGLWMGGISSDNQLKLAAVLFRAEGNDFWPGPLDTTSASVTPETCLAFDKFWITERAEVETFIAWYQCQSDPENCNLDELFPDGYSVPPAFVTWPAEGSLDLGQDPYLAPFVDFNEDGVYEPGDGDYPDYGLDETVEQCKNRVREDAVNLFGDYNIFWIFNDKGDVHTESFGGEPIGLEVRAQAFAFSSNNEVNNMTFYNYTVINQGEQTLNDTYFGHFVDPDLGCSNDDFVGCDVQRGFGFAYNWDENDESGCAGVPGYGVQPPAIGVDFFEGPYQDADQVDNPGPQSSLEFLDCIVAQQQDGIPYKGLGIGYGDGFPDNERFGMRAFLYWNRDGPPATADPRQQGHFYNYLRGIWTNGVVMSFGGDGYDETVGVIPTRYMFPWSSDPVGWGTNCVPQPDWRETTQAPQDRRFVQSAGPFTLEPGAYNNITIGVAYARAATGGAAASVTTLRVADDKAQALFDNCFKILDGPDAPDMDIVELDRELVLFLSNPEGSNNNQQQPVNKPPLSYEELDPIIPESSPDGELYDRYYRFQGYKVYQVRNADVSVADLENEELARQVYQGDIEDDISQIINYPYDETLGMPVPVEMVNGANEGIASSIRITEDKFAQGDPRLVNFKSYYYIAIAYGYNQYEPYDLVTRSGQAFPYVASRKAAFGSIRRYVGIPHRPDPGSGGTILNAAYGDGFSITRLEGQGNGGNATSLTRESIEAIAAEPGYRQQQITYEKGLGPVTVKVIDPLKVPLADFQLWMKDDTATSGDLGDANWFLIKLASGEEPDTVRSERVIDLPYEQVIPGWGLSVQIQQATVNGDFAEPIGEGTIEFADPTKPWFTGIPDGEADVVTNWIRSGVYNSPESPLYADRSVDPDELWENYLGGTWAPWALVGHADFQPGTPSDNDANVPHPSMTNALLRRTPGIQLIITSDRSKWSRSPVFEEASGGGQGGAARMALRSSPSIDKDGRRAGQEGYNASEGSLVNGTGMGWFPGYAVDIETGERLNIGYGENSVWGGGIGQDMKWNPNDQFFNGGASVFGGGHWIYVFKNERRLLDNDNEIPQYDQGQFIRTLMQGNASAARLKTFKSIGWVGSAMVVPGQEFMATDVRITLNVKKPYESYEDYDGGPGDIDLNAQNGGLPLYKFSTSGLETVNNDQTTAESALDLISVVPNPYYAFSGYETSRLDNRVKFINLPQVCTISIYTVSGTLVRKYKKDNELTYLDWDLKNTFNIPIAGGVYICHVDVPGVGEKVVNWFGALRPLDLQNF